MDNFVPVRHQIVEKPGSSFLGQGQLDTIAEALDEANRTRDPRAINFSDNSGLLTFPGICARVGKPIETGSDISHRVLRLKWGGIAPRAMCRLTLAARHPPIGAEKCLNAPDSPDYHLLP